MQVLDGRMELHVSYRSCKMERYAGSTGKAEEKVTYFDPDVYNKYNLSDDDRDEIELYGCMIADAIDVVKSDIEEELADAGDNPIAKGIAAYKLETVEDVRRMMAFSLHGILADRIESYDDDTYEGLQVRGDHERRVKGVEYTDMFAPAFELLKKWEDS
jgi:hypothetical protein